LPWTRRPLDAISLQGKNIVVMGGTGGIGRALALCAAAPGAEVTIVGRTFRDVGVPRVRFVEAELSSMKNVRRLARDLPAEEIVHVRRSLKKNDYFLNMARFRPPFTPLFSSYSGTLFIGLVNHKPGRKNSAFAINGQHWRHIELKCLYIRYSVSRSPTGGSRRNRILEVMTHGACNQGSEF
jgi:NAD(P)-dependent dehydrogenase (short-subunit alcohol dehydrogenase family)